VKGANLGGKNKQPLLATLWAALASIERGNSVAAANQLHAFQNKVRAQVADPTLAAQFIEVAQQVIDALEAAGRMPCQSFRPRPGAARSVSRGRPSSRLLEGKGIERPSTLAAIDETFKRAPESKKASGEQSVLGI